MAYHPKQRLDGRARRKVRVRKKIFGTAERPRLTVYRSAQHIYAQVVDDLKGHTLAAVSTVAKSVKGDLKGNKTEKAKIVGKALAEACQKQNVTTEARR